MQNWLVYLKTLDALEELNCRLEWSHELMSGGLAR